MIDDKHAPLGRMTQSELDERVPTGSALAVDRWRKSGRRESGHEKFPKLQSMADGDRSPAFQGRERHRPHYVEAAGRAMPSRDVWREKEGREQAGGRDGGVAFHRNYNSVLPPKQNVHFYGRRTLVPVGNLIRLASEAESRNVSIL